MSHQTEVEPKPVLIYATRYTENCVEFDYAEAKDIMRQAAGAPIHARVYFDDGDPYGGDPKIAVIWDSYHTDIRDEVSSERA